MASNHSPPEGLRKAKDRNGLEIEINLSYPERIGSGAFCVAYSYLLEQKGLAAQRVALKACNSHKDFKNREQEILLTLNHPNIIKMIYYFSVEEVTYLVLELMDNEDLFDVMRNGYNGYDGIGIYAELYAFQLFRGIAYCHAKGVIHRDLKPENLLLRHEDGLLKIGDFGISVVDEKPGHMRSYVGTRDFRAPEMLLGATKYDCKIDVWSALVVLTELVLNQPIFGENSSSESLLSKISEYLGTPTDEDYKAMKVSRRFVGRKKPILEFSQSFEVGPENHDYDNLLDLLQQGLLYNPKERSSAWDACSHKYFDKLANPNLKLPNGRQLPDLFDFTAEEFESMPSKARTKFETSSHLLSDY